MIHEDIFAAGLVWSVHPVFSNISWQIPICNEGIASPVLLKPYLPLLGLLGLHSYCILYTSISSASPEGLTSRF